MWSFNHVQMQCYAVMKLILKEFIKLRCRPENNVLCSYFIKTFLFWKLESTNLQFWNSSNFRECLKYLLVEFAKDIHDGVLRHYFFPRFNLLSVKLTPEAQAETLQILDVIIMSDIALFKDCKTLQNTWSKFLAFNGNFTSTKQDILRQSLLKKDSLLMKRVHRIQKLIYELRHTNVSTFIDSDISRISSLTCKTPIKSFVLSFLYFQKHLWMTTVISQRPENKDVFRLRKIVQKNTLSTDISTCKMWYALTLLLQKDYQSTLTSIDQILSNIPPFALYFSSNFRANDEAKGMYVEKFFDTESTTENRAKMSWLFDIVVGKDSAEFMPLGLQIELYFCDPKRGVVVSPFTFAYYLMFLCHHELRQYDQRDRSLRQLVDVTNSTEQCGGWPYHSYNITGHCLLLAGDTYRAQDMFDRSYQWTRRERVYHKYNSAKCYLQQFCGK